MKFVACGAAALAIGAAFPAAARTPPQPYVLNPLFTDHPSAPMAEGPKVLCRVRIVALRDARTDPETMGVLLDRAVKSPPDRDAWLKSIAGGLTARDIDVRFDEDDEKALAISLTLRTAWLSLLKSTKQASVVFRLEPGDAYSGKAARDYRASITATNWIGSRSEIQGMIDRAIAASLDQLAADLRQACGADFASPPH